MAKTSVYIPKSFREDEEKIANGYRSVDEETAARWVGEGKARLTSKATASEDVDNKGAAKGRTPDDFVPGVFDGPKAPSQARKANSAKPDPAPNTDAPKESDSQ